MILFWIFGLSLLGTVLIFLNKFHELKHKKETFITRILSRYDRILERVILRFYFFFKRIEDNLYDNVVSAVPRLLRALKHKISAIFGRLSDRFVDFFRGKKEIIPRAKVSKFIASALEYRYHSERERKKLLDDTDE